MSVQSAQSRPPRTPFTVHR